MAIREVKKGDTFVWDFGHGQELVQCAGRAPKDLTVIGFYTEDGGLFVYKEQSLIRLGLKFIDEGGCYGTR